MSIIIDCARKGMSYEEYCECIGTNAKSLTYYGGLKARFKSMKANSEVATQQKETIKLERLRAHQQHIKEAEEKRKIKEARLHEEKIKAEIRFQRFLELSPSLLRKDYIIKNEDYKRGNPKENTYRKVFCLPLLSLFDNRCARCGDNHNGFELDHFMFPKNEGGNFIMESISGYMLNNCIPLCISCNRSKGEKGIFEFFNMDTLEVITKKNKIMTEFINKFNRDNM